MAIKVSRPWRGSTARFAFLVATALVGGVLVVVSPGTASAASGCVPGGSQVTCTYSYNGTNGSNGSAQSFVVPTGVTQVTIQVWGGSGPDAPARVHGPGGLGGHAGATVPVTPGEMLRVRVGSNRGFNSGNLSGGGATDVRQGGDTLTNRIVVAGGGGGGGGLCFDATTTCIGFRGGDGGGVHGGDGIGNVGGPIDFAGGGGPTTGGFSLVGIAGSFGAGGESEGGGGWYGGGGGGFIETANSGGAAPGGGGSGFVTLTATGPTINEAGINTGDGKATIIYTVPTRRPQFFSVALRCTTLRVGYINFPAGTNVNYDITGAGTKWATGHFTTNAGRQFLTVPLGTRLPPDDHPTLAVHLHWHLNGTAFTYVPSRDSNC